MREILISLVAAVLLCSCSAMNHIQYVDVPRIEKEYVVKIDTTIIRDSVMVNRYQKADTVYLNKEKYRYITKIQRDTLHRTDTVSVIKEVEVEKPYVPDYYHRVSTGFWVLLTLFVMFIAYKIWRLWKRI